MGRTLTVVAAAAVLVAVGWFGWSFVLGGSSSPGDCGLGTGGVDVAATVNESVESPGEARRAFDVALNDSDGVDLRGLLSANATAYEYADIDEAMRDDITDRAEGRIVAESETVYYFTVNGSVRAGDAVGVTESGTVFSARYGAC